MTIACEEIFGPVLLIIPLEREGEAIKIANYTVYGLTNYVQTQDRVSGGTPARRSSAMPAARE